MMDNKTLLEKLAAIDVLRNDVVKLRVAIRVLEERVALLVKEIETKFEE